MKKWLRTFISDLSFLGKEFRKEFLDPSVLNDGNKASIRKFDPSNELVRPASVKNSNSILSYRR